MMSNLNFNIYNLPPTQHYQEYGDYDQTNDTSAVPLVYVPTIHSIQYTGVTSFEFNGTTYYDYNLYEAPILSLYSYPVYDYTPEVYSDDYQYGDNTAFVDDTDDDTLFSTHYSQYSYDSISSHLSTDFNTSITYNISHSNFFSTSMQCRNNSNNIIDEDKNSYILENNVSFTEPSSSSCNSFLNLNENAEINYQNDPQPNNEIENIPLTKNEDTDLQNGDDSYRNISVMNIKHDSYVSNESTVYEQSVGINENELNEHCDNYSFISEESKVLDWTIEVNDDLGEKEEEDDDDNDDDDDNNVNDDDKEEDDEDYDANKVNFSTLSDIDPYYSTEVVKYLKEQLYLYALSGHLSLKESLPVVDILPIIEENSESVENDDISEPTVEVLENREGNIQNAIEDNILYNVSFDISEPLVENHGTEFKNERMDQVKRKITNVTEDDTKSFPIFNMSQKSVSNKKLHKEQRHEVLNTDDKLLVQVQESKEVLTQLSSVEESDILVENVPKLAETDIVFNASSKMNQSEEKNLSKSQIMVTKQFVSTGDSLGSNADSLLKPVKNVEKRNKVTSNPVHRNQVHNTTVHVPIEAGSHDKCYSGANVEKNRKSEEKISIKGEKKKFNTFRKWLSHLCCCVRKNT